MRPVRRGRPARPHPSARVTTAPPPARLLAGPDSSRGPLPKAKLREDAERGGRGSSSRADRRGGLRSFQRPNGLPITALPTGPSSSGETLAGSPRSRHRGPQGPQLQATRGPDPVPRSSEPRVRMLRGSPHRAWVNPDRAIARPAKRSSSGAIG